MNILKGIRVLDMSKVLAGPQCAMLLGDLGADVIKIETPGVGDDTRNMGAKQEGLAGFYVSCNRNKRGLTLNLKKAEAVEALYRMVEKSDVFIENLITGGAEKLKVDYETLKKINPQIIYVSISGYGRSGPYAKKGGYDMMAQATGGIMSVTGLPGLDEPIRVGYSITDIGTGTLAAFGVLAALRNREMTGEGQKIEASLLHTQIGYASYFLTQYGITRENPVPSGTKHASMAPYQTFKTKNGKLIMGMSNESQWKRFCTIKSFEQLGRNPQYDNMASRVANRDALAEEIEKVFLEMNTKDVVAMLDEYGIPNSPINTMQDLFEDEYIYNEMMMELDFPEQGKFVVPRFPLVFSDETPLPQKLPPMLGEDNDQILTNYGFTDSEITELKACGAV